jgi:hypothetical protein
MVPLLDPRRAVCLWAATPSPVGVTVEAALEERHLGACLLPARVVVAADLEALLPAACPLAAMVVEGLVVSPLSTQAATRRLMGASLAA